MKTAIPTLFCLALIFIFASPAARAEMDIAGVWKNIDAETGKAKSHIRIWEKDGVYYGKIEYILDRAGGTRCTDCPGARKDRPLVGMVMLWGMKKSEKKDGGLVSYSGGRLMDVFTGNDYSCRISQVSDNKIMVRRYVLFFYRTQYWYRVK
jgi:uncharacterized protein (DUF2147 family)